MKKTLLVGLAIGLVSVAATAAFAGMSATMNVPAQGYAAAKNIGGNGIVGSSHDLSNVGNKTGSIAAAALVGSGGTGKDAQSRICIFCHHPHNADSATAAGDKGGRTGTKAAIGSYSPLWNRNLSSQTFVGYTNGALMTDSAITASDKRHVLNAGATTKIAGVSLLCMSCHDGVVAMNAYSQTTGSELGAGTNSGPGISSSAGFKGNMNNHHPMGFAYAAVQTADAEIAPAETVMVPENASPTASTADHSGSVTIGSLLYGNDVNTATFECVTCHDVHNTANAPGAERFLWRSNNSSNFCLTCHLK